MGKIKSYTSSSGTKIIHYDERGNKTGYSVFQHAGYIKHYDAEHSLIGETTENGLSYVTKI